MVNSIKCSREVNKTDTIFLRPYGIDEVHVVVDIQNSRLSRVVLTVCRLVRILEMICGQILSETRFYNMLFILFLGYYG